MTTDTKPYVVDKAGWGDGPWHAEPDRVEWEHAGLPCLAVRGPAGAWCGYAAVPPAHPLHGKSTEDIDVEVHGGLTYANRCQGHICHVPKPGEPDDVYWFGFDCAHSGDSPHLLIEMEAERVMDEIQEVKKGNRTKKTRIEKKAGGHFIHNMHVLKDRAMVLNGLMFAFKDINTYKAGDWKAVYRALAPHFAKMKINGGQGNKGIEERSSSALFNGRGDSDYQKRVKLVGITLEEIEATIVKLWPGSDAKSKALKALAIEVLFKTRSWKAVESKSLEDLQSGLTALRLFEEQTTNGNKAESLVDPVQASGLLAICSDKVRSDAAEAVEAAVL